MQTEEQRNITEAEEMEKIDLVSWLQDYLSCLKKFWLQFLLIFVIVAGIVVSYLFSLDSSIRTTVIIVGIIMIGIGWYKKSKSDKKVFQYIEQLKNIDMN